jgi:hypothetical protein
METYKTSVEAILILCNILKQYDDGLTTTEECYNQIIFEVTKEMQRQELQQQELLNK